MATYDFDQSTIRSGPNGELLTTGIYATGGSFYGYRIMSKLAGGDGNDTLVGGASASRNIPPIGWGGNEPLILNYTGDDGMSGGAGNDLISGNQGNDGLGGGSGDDTLYGGAGNDSLAGDQDNDLLNGDEGNDFLRGGPGNDVYYGGAGDDLLQDDAYLGSGADAGPNNDRMYGGDGNDTLNGYTGADAMYGDAGDDVIYVGTGDTTIDGGTGNDTAIAGTDITSATFLNVEHLRIFSRDASTVTLTAAQYNSFTTVGVLRGPNGDVAGATGNLRSATFVLSGGGSVGANFFSSEMAPSSFIGSALADTINFSTSTNAWGVDAGEGADSVLGGTGNDGITGAGGNDTLAGGAGDDTLIGSAGNDVLYGDIGNDSLDGGADDDALHGGDGNDTLTGGAGSDAQYGEGGDDLIYAGTGDTILDGGTGNDLLVAGGDIYLANVTIQNIEALRIDGTVRLKSTQLAGFSAVRTNASGDSVNIVLMEGGVRVGDNFLFDQIRAGATIAGIRQTDPVVYANLDDIIDLSGATRGWGVSGGDGNDSITGGAGNDNLAGDDGNDTLTGGAGNDTITGGTGNDSIDGSTGTDLALLSGPQSAYRIGIRDNILITNGPDGQDQYANIEAFQWGNNAAINLATLQASSATTGLLYAALAGKSAAYILPDLYTGPVPGLTNQLLATATNDVISGTTGNDFINALAGDDAVHGGAGNDVIDGGLGSNFLTGGAGRDIFFLDGRGAATAYSWATITDFSPGEQVTIWGYKPGISRFLWVASDGAVGFKGATLHADLDGNGQTDTSLTFSGLTQEQLPTQSFGTVGGYDYVFFG